MWPCIAAPQRSPPPCHNLSGSPAGSHEACTLSRCKTEALVCTHLGGGVGGGSQGHFKQGQVTFEGLLYLLRRTGRWVHINTDQAAERGLGV